MASPRHRMLSQSALFTQMQEREEEEARSRDAANEKSEDEIMDEWLERAGWKEEWDQTSKMVYYFNDAGESRWERPSLEELQATVRQALSTMSTPVSSTPASSTNTLAQSDRTPEPAPRAVVVAETGENLERITDVRSGRARRKTQSVSSPRGGRRRNAGGEKLRRTQTNPAPRAQQTSAHEVPKKSVPPAITAQQSSQQVRHKPMPMQELPAVSSPKSTPAFQRVPTSEVNSGRDAGQADSLDLPAIETAGLTQSFEDSAADEYSKGGGMSLFCCCFPGTKK